MWSRNRPRNGAERNETELGFEELAFPCAIASPGPMLKPMLINIVMKSELERCIYPPYWQHPPVYRFASRVRRGVSSKRDGTRH